MNPRDVVKRTLEFDRPPRVPRQLWLLPWAELHHPEAAKRIRDRFPDDVVSTPSLLKEKLPGRGARHARGQYVDEWGCVYENLEEGIIGEVKQPILADWQDLDRVHIPRERLSVDVEGINAFCRSTDQFTLSCAFPRIFEQLQFIRGTENLMCDLFDEPEELSILMERMHELYLAEISVWSQTEVDGLMFMDDWGTQHSLMIKPEQWRRMFRPLYEEYFRIAREHGKYVFFHSDGYILDILEDFVELGVNALNSQVFCMGLDAVGERFAGRITFWGDFDRQQLLPRGTRDEVVDAARRMKEQLYRDGGLIAQCEFGPGANPENVEAFLEYWGDA